MCGLINVGQLNENGQTASQSRNGEHCWLPEWAQDKKKHDAASSQEAKVYGALKRLQQKADLLMVWHYATLV